MKKLTYRIAFVLGKQGSGKTSRVCRPISRRLLLWNIWHKLRFRPGKIFVWADTFNHLRISDDNEVEFIYEVYRGRGTFGMKELAGGVHIIEFPHSGYFPPNSGDMFNNETINSRIFAIELPEQLWRSIGCPETGEITSPEYFMEHGRSISPRSLCDYQADTKRIRNDILCSGIPFQIFSDAGSMVKSIRDFVLEL